MIRCQCIKKTDGCQCTRKASIKPIHNPIYCWQHQKCQKSIGQIPEVKPLIFKKNTKVPEKIFIEKPFILESDKIIICDPNMGQKSLNNVDQSTIIKGVIGGLWDANVTSVRDMNSQFSHLTQIEAHSYDIKTVNCKWDYEGVIKTEMGWVGIFDYGILSKMSLTKITENHNLINRFNFGVYVDIGLPGDFEVYSCPDARGNIVAIRINFLKGIKIH